ncbi:MAG: pilus assembly protein PilM [Bacilli bacterium]|nr:pilus assembly protein PilM [Bacilli bacterium]
MRKIFTCIDIGTDTIKAVTMEEYNEKFNVLATAISPSKGVRKGLIVDANAITGAIKKVIKELESKLGAKIEQVLAIVPSNNRDISIATGDINIHSDDHIIDGDVIFNCMQKSVKKNINASTEIVSIMPIEYKINDNKKVKNPLGLQGDKLSIKSVVVSVPKKNVYSVVGILENMGIEVVDIITSSIANYAAVSDEEFDKKIVAIIDIGKEKTVLSVFNKGILIKESIVSIGSDAIDEAISFNYKTEEDKSKTIKEEYGVANRKYADSDENYKIVNRLDQELELNQYPLAETIEFKIIEMLKNVKNDVNNLTNREISYIIVTGASTAMLGFDALVSDVYGSKGQVLSTNIIGIRDVKYATCYGAIKYFVNKLNLREKEYTMFSDEKVDDMLKARKKMGTGSVLGKIFGRIFE